MTPQEFDRSVQNNKAWSGEFITSSDFDGPFNFLLGGIYSESRVTENSYYVSGFAIDYISGLFGGFQSIFNEVPNPDNPAKTVYKPLDPSFLGTPFIATTRTI